MLWVGMPIIRNTVLSAGGHAKGIAEICAAMDIAVEDLDDAEKRISLDQGIAGIVAAIRVSGDPFLALHLGERTNVSALGLAGLIMESSKDALAVLRCAQEFTQAFTNVQTFMLETLDHEVHFHIEPVPAWTERSPETAMFVTDTAFASLLNQLYLLTRKRIIPLAVHYRQPRPVDTKEHERILRCRPEFDREANRMIFAIDDLRVPVLGHNKPLSDMLRNLYEEQVRRSVSGSFSEKVKQVVFGNMQVSFPSLEVIAEVLNMTPRTLQRKLSMEGTSFRAVTDALKQELAENLLANPALTIADIAYKLGYFEPTSFQRAFRQWTGTTPMEYRKSRK
jgi:AraC-like DNA-binding protein